MRTDAVEDVPISLKNQNYSIIDASYNLNSFSLYDNVVRECYLLCGLFGVICRNIFVVEDMPDYLISSLIISDEFDAIFFIENENSKDHVEFTHRALIETKNILDQFSNLSNSLKEAKIFANSSPFNELQKILHESHETIHGAMRSFFDTKQIWLSNIKPDIIKYLNSKKFRI
jgi:hypothetical protein